MTTVQAGDIFIEQFDVIACSKCAQQIDVSETVPFTLMDCPACGAQMRVPARFANFILLEQLGRGGMGAVYKAYDETLGRTVALKVMQQSIGQDRAFVEQFLQEARALAAINSPNIVQIYNYGEENGQPYIVMELVDGGRLDHLHEKHKALDEIFVLQTAQQVIRGLQAANAAGMTHGDIKPANILFDKAGNAKVADFGLARLKGEKPKPGEVWGTPYYVAPEVVRGQAPDAGADIYSLGGTLYHVLTGEPPFNGETVTDTVLLRFKEPAPDPREFKSNVAPKTAAILLRMLALDPFARYPTYESVLTDITEVLTPQLEARSGKTAAPQKKSPAVPVILGLVALAVVIASTIFGLHFFKATQEKKRAAAEFERKKISGEIRQVMRGGRLVWVDTATLVATAPGTSGAAALHPPAGPVNSWDIRASTDTSISGDNASPDFRDRTILLVRAGSTSTLDNASKVYLRFLLEGVDRRRLDSAMLQLTAGRKGPNKLKSARYKLYIWALKNPAVWDDTLTWAAAPGNDPASASHMKSAQATKLLEFDMPANPETGDRIQIPFQPLVAFLRSYTGDDITIVLTGDLETDHRGGWRITATEDSGRFPPPTLYLKAK